MANGSNNKSNELIQQVSKGLKTGNFSTKGIIAMVLFGMIILVFVLFGFDAKHHGSEGVGSAARVNNTLVSMADLGSETARLEQMYAPLFGGQVAGDAQRQFLRQQALESLIVQELVAQHAKKEGILATDAEIQNTLVKEIPAFQQDGRFQKEAYFQILEANRLTPAEFESKLRKEKMNLRTRRLFELAAQPMDFELAKLQTLREMKMNVAFAEIEKDKVIANLKTLDAKAQLANPEFAKKVEEYYANNKAEFSSEEEVRAQHILIKVDDKTSDEKAKEMILLLKNRASKEDFGKLAKENSQDAGSKGKDGDLGYFSKGKMVPEFEAAAFSQKVGEVGEPVKSSFGYHLIKVTDKKAAQQKALDQVREVIASKILGAEVYESESKKLEEALAKGDAATVDASLKKMGVNWQETGFFELSADRVPKLESPEASKAAFAVTDKIPLYPQVIRDGSQKFVIRFKEAKKEAAAPGLNLSMNLAQERSSDLFGAWIETAKKTSVIERNINTMERRQQ